MNLAHISAGENLPWDVNVLIEIPYGGPPVKYEIHHTLQTLVSVFIISLKPNSTLAFAFSITFYVLSHFG